MNRTVRIVLKALAVAVLLTACTKSSDGNSDGPSTPEELSDRLVTVTDLGTNWRETQRDVFTMREPENPSIDPSLWCPGAEDIAVPLVGLAGDSGADVEMENKTSTGGTEMLRLQAWSNDDVEEYFSTAVEAVEKCDGAQWSNAGATLTIEKGVVNDLGDESIRWKTEIVVDGADDKMTSYGYTQIVRFGDDVMVLQLGTFAMQGGVPATDDGSWVKLIDTIVNFFQES